ncbi:hypothetical protein [Streptantibioticus parmotrematis]
MATGTGKTLVATHSAEKLRASPGAVNAPGSGLASPRAA